MLSVIVGSIVAVICIITIFIHKLGFNKKLEDTWVGVLSIVFLILSLFFGCFILPLLVPDTNKYELVVNAEVIFNENAVIVDLVNSPQAKYQTLYKFDKYKSVVEIGDSTKFFMRLEKSFYGAILDRDLVWSNPPYNIYNLK